MLPNSIRTHIQGKTGHADSVGMSGSQILIFDDCVLKTEGITPCTEDSIAAMIWLSHRVPAPRVLAHEIHAGKSWLLMSRIPGRMSCAPEYLAQPEILVEALSEGLRVLWRTDWAGCPRDRTLPHLLREAEYRIAHQLVDLDHVEPETFGEGGFRDPESLLSWLKAHPVKSEPVLTHGDYCLPNIFLHNRAFSGFVDVSDCGVGEKWRDIALCYRSLRDNMNGSYGAKSYPDFDPCVLFDALGIEPDWEQIRWHLLLDELF